MRARYKSCLADTFFVHRTVKLNLASLGHLLPAVVMKQVQAAVATAAAAAAAAAAVTAEPRAVAVVVDVRSTCQTFVASVFSPSYLWRQCD